MFTNLLIKFNVWSLCKSMKSLMAESRKMNPEMREIEHIKYAVSGKSDWSRSSESEFTYKNGWKLTIDDGDDLAGVIKKILAITIGDIYRRQEDHTENLMTAYSLVDKYLK